MSGSLRAHFFPSPPVRDTSLLTGFPARHPEPHTVEYTDPTTGESAVAVLFRYPAVAPHRRAGRAGQGAQLPAPLLMVHGFRGDHHGMALVVDCLPEYEIWVPDLPGFGASPAFPAAPHSTQNYAQFVNQLPVLLDLTSPVLVGHSFGSIIASYSAAQPDSEWQALALLNPIARLALNSEGPWTERAGAKIAAGFYSVSAGLPRTAGRWLLSAPPMVWATGVVMSRSADPKVVAYTHGQHQQYFSSFDTPEALLEAYQASVSTTAGDVAQHVNVAVLLLAGGQDPLASVADQQRLAKQFENAETLDLQIIAETGHLMHYETPQHIAQRLRAFLSSGRAPGGGGQN